MMMMMMMMVMMMTMMMTMMVGETPLHIGKHSTLEPPLVHTLMSYISG